MRVRLKTKFGQFWDRRIRWGITAGEIKEIPDPLPQDTLTYQKLRLGGFEIIKNEAEAAATAVMDAPVYEVTEISTVTKPAPTTDAGRAAVDDSADVIPSKEGIQDGSPIESGMTTEPEATSPSAETPIPPAPKPAPKKRGRPKKAK